jgi:N utilization substance protein B
VKRRHRARRLTLQGLCCLDVQDAHVKDLVEEFISDNRVDREVAADALALLRGAFEGRAESDVLLRRHTRHWNLERLALVDRNILRLAAYEMSVAGTPHKVAISEAMHLAREFSTAESPRFVNGILDAVHTELNEGKE